MFFVFKAQGGELADKLVDFVFRGVFFPDPFGNLNYQKRLVTKLVTFSGPWKNAGVDS